MAERILPSNCHIHKNVPSCFNVLYAQLLFILLLNFIQVTFQRVKLIVLILFVLIG